MKIKILVLDITQRGGVERFVSNIASLLTNNDVMVDVVSFHKTYPSPIYDFNENIQVVYLTKFSFTTFFYKFVALYACAQLVIKDWLGDRTCIYISTSPIISILTSLISTSGLKKRLVASEHSTYQAHNAIIRLLRSVTYRKIGAIVTQTSVGVELFRSVNLKASKIPNPITDFPLTTQWVRKIKNTTLNRPFNFLAVGRFDTVKQFDHYINAAKIVNDRFPETRFDLVGVGKLYDEYRLLINKLDLHPVFTLHPASKDISRFYSKSNAFVICSSTEAFPMVMIEALSFGLPVISYDNLVGPVEVVKNYVNGILCKQNSVDSLADAMCLILNDQEQYNRLQTGAMDSALPYRSLCIKNQWKTLLSDLQD